MTTTSSAFVASTMPIMFIDKMARDFGIKRIYIINDTHADGYKYLQQKNPGIHFIFLPRGFIRHSLKLLFVLLSIKIKRENVLFFHECCWELFDVLLNIINITSDCYPHVTLNSLSSISVADVSAFDKRKLFLILFRQISRFKPYVLQTDCNTIATVWSCENYSSNITIHAISDAWEIREKGIDISCAIVTRKILFIVGTDLIDNECLAYWYVVIANLLIDKGYEVWIKDHPNVESRLNINTPSKVKVYDPALPVELLSQDFLCVIGFASTGLINFRTKAISIIYLFEAQREVLEARVAHLNPLCFGSEIKFPHTLEELLECVDKFNGEVL